MIYMITDSGVRSAKNFHEFNNKYHVLLEEAECTPLGPDLVVTATSQDLEFLQDKARMSNIMFGNFFRKDLRNHKYHPVGVNYIYKVNVSRAFLLQLLIRCAAVLPLRYKKGVRYGWY